MRYSGVIRHMNFKSRSASVIRWLAVVIFCAGVPCVRAQQKWPDMESLASDVAAAIRKSPEASTETVKVRVFDFREKYNSPTSLAHEFATQFADALQKKAQGFVVMNPDEFRQAISKTDLPAEVFSCSPAMHCYASELGATMLVEGEMRVAPDGAVLEVTVWSATAQKFILRESGVFPMTNFMEGLFKIPASASRPADLSRPEERLWVSTEHPPVSDSQVVKFDGDRPGFTPPVCLLCPNPHMSDAAVLAQLDGSILLRAQILADGSVAKVSVVRGLPCGLTDEALKAVKTWTFKPATGPDGKPVVADTPIEVIFRFY
jgi:TonB family protein